MTIAEPAATPGQPGCFFISQWQGWKAPASDVLYLGVNGRGVFRESALPRGPRCCRTPATTSFGGTAPAGGICQPVQINLALSDGKGLYVPLIAKTLTKLTPEEVAAIPKQFQPN